VSKWQKLPHQIFAALQNHALPQVAVKYNFCLLNLALFAYFHSTEIKINRVNATAMHKTIPEVLISRKT